MQSVSHPDLKALQTLRFIIACFKFPKLRMIEITSDGIFEKCSYSPTAMFKLFEIYVIVICVCFMYVKKNKFLYDGQTFPDILDIILNDVHCVSSS